MEIRVCECKKPLCRYRWIPRLQVTISTINKDGTVTPDITEGYPKECPSCKHQFTGCSWSIKPKCWIETVNNMNELKTLKESIKKWNQEGRFTASY